MGEVNCEAMEAWVIYVKGDVLRKRFGRAKGLGVGGCRDGVNMCMHYGCNGHYHLTIICASLALVLQVQRTGPLRA